MSAKWCETMEGAIPKHQVTQEEEEGQSETTATTTDSEGAAAKLKPHAE
jgi:hypothetical protein